MKQWVPALVMAAALCRATGADAAAVTYSPSAIEPPQVRREFRGVWIATVGNIDWPSTNNLTTSQQKAEMVAILDRAAKLNMNAVILQVRPICDALYESPFEPWSYYLNGMMGRAPSPYYDPLKFALEEAHKRGIELHAWFSPYRAGPRDKKYPISANHISRTRPGWVRQNNNNVWLDPGIKEVQDYTIKVIMDVVDRYDIDGVHFDDRLGYPTGEDPFFPDSATHQNYVKKGGQLERDDWRRENVNSLVSRVYFSIKAAKPWVKFGIAPSGIWQQGFPPQIKGQSAYSALYTDSRKWLANGWVDYFSPQLYWTIDAPDQSFPVLMKWWQSQNVKHRNLWPGLFTEKIGGSWRAEEIIRQVGKTRELGGSAPGVIHYSAKVLKENRGGIVNALAAGLYAEPALAPAFPWLEKTQPGKPSLTVTDGHHAKWQPAGTEQISVWVVQTWTSGQWQTRILSGDTRSAWVNGAPDVLAVTAIDRCGVAGPAAVLKRNTDAGPGK